MKILKVMNNTLFKISMKQYIKYICLFLMLVGINGNVWGDGIYIEHNSTKYYNGSTITINEELEDGYLLGSTSFILGNNAGWSEGVYYGYGTIYADISGSSVPDNIYFSDEMSSEDVYPYLDEGSTSSFYAYNDYSYSTINFQTEYIFENAGTYSTSIVINQRDNSTEEVLQSATITLRYVVTSTCSKPTVAFSSSDLYKLTDADNFTKTATVKHNDSNTGQTITYTSNNTSVATVNSSTGEVSIKGIVGTATITATATGNATYCTANGSYTLHVYTSPTINTTNFKGESLTPTSATFSGCQISDNGGLPITSYGYVIGTSSSVEWTTKVSAAGVNGDPGLNTDFTAQTTNTELTPGTTYYVRGFAYNGKAFAYTTHGRFTTPYEVTLNKNNSDVTGSTNGSAYVSPNGTSITSITAPTREHYTIEGYYTTTDCTTKISNDEGVLQPDIIVSENEWTDGDGKWTRGDGEIFYAKWTPKNYTISFDANGGTGEMGDVEKAYNTSYALPACGFTAPSGKVFDGWAEGSAVGTKRTLPYEHTVTGDITFYAVWRDAAYNDWVFSCAELELEEPDNGADNVLENVVYLTSTSGQKVRSTAKFHITGTGLTASEEVKFTTGDDDLDAVYSFKKEDGTAVSTDPSGRVDEDVYIFYQPTETTDGRDIITALGGIEAYVDRNAEGITLRSTKNTARTINGRHLPGRFIIAAKSGGVWYALPSDASVTGAQMGYTFTPDNATTPTEASVAPQTALYTLYAPTADATNPSYVRLASTNSNKALWSNNSSAIGIKDNALISGGSAKGNQYEWRLENTGADSYKLFNNASNSGAGRYLGMNGTKWNVFASGGGTVQDIKILSVDDVSEYIGLSATEWEETAFNFSITSGTPPTSPSLDHVQVGYNGKNYEASIAGSKLTITDEDFVTDGGFGAASGSQLFVEWFNSSDVVLAQGSLISPIIINTNTVDLSEYDAEALAGTDIFVTNGAQLTVNQNVTIHDMTVNSGSTLCIGKADESTGVTLTLASGKLELKGGWTTIGDEEVYDMPRIYIDPLSSLAKTSTTVNFDISVDERNYYPFAVPFRVRVKDIDYANSTLAYYSEYGPTGQYVIKEYDGASRAENGPNPANWKVVPQKDDEGNDVYLEPGRGYILTAVSLPSYGGGVIRFPMTITNAWTTLGEQGTVSDVTKNIVAVTAHEGDATAGDKKVNKGWNLLGVPFMSCYTAGEVSNKEAVIQGRYNFETNTWDDEEIQYVNVPTHNFSEYIQTSIEEAVLLPGWCFFVQIAESGNLTFLSAGQAEESNMPIYAPKREQADMPTVKTGIILSGDEASDKTTFLVSDKYSATEYEINADLEKLFGNGYTLATYSLSGETRLAYNALSNADAANLIPIGYRAPAEGEYTFSINPRYAENGAFKSVNLVDYETGVVTDLMMYSYTFFTDRTQNDSRFAINVEKQKDTPTDVENVQGDDVRSTKVRKLILNDKVYIIRGGQMYDATGKRVQEINK